MKMPNNPAKYEVLIKQYLRSILDISTDTNAFMLALRRLPELCQNTSFVTRRGQRHHKILHRPIVQALGPARTAALPGFHVWSGADFAGSFTSKGKLGVGNHFLRLTRRVLLHLQIWVQSCNLHQVAIEKLVCHSSQ